MNRNQVPQLQNLRNLESLKLIASEVNSSDISLLPHLRHISTRNNHMNFDAIFSGINSITSIHSILFLPRNHNLALNFRNTTKQITSLTFFNFLVEDIHEISLFTKFISSLKHVTIVLELDVHEDFNRFLMDSTVLESIKIRKIRKIPYSFIQIHTFF